MDVQGKGPRSVPHLGKKGIKFEIMATSFFLTQRFFRRTKGKGLPTWQERLFLSLLKSAANATDFYHLPSSRVIVLGQQLQI